MHREEILLGMFDSNGKGLEIGPGYSPLLPKTRYAQVESLDYSTKAELLEKYATANVDLGRIEEPNYVSDGRAMAEVIGSCNQYDFIVASHVIEHTIDLVGFLRDCEQLMRPGGRLVLAVPDKRYCFDFLRATTTTAGVLSATLQTRSVHSKETYFDSFANASLRGDAIGWGGAAYDRNLMSFSYKDDYAFRDYMEPCEHSAYRDEHAWVFTPSSLRLILDDLFALKRVALRECAFHDTLGIEFFVALSTNGAGSGLSRLALACTANEELAAPFTEALRARQVSLDKRLAARDEALHEAEVEAAEHLRQIEELSAEIDRVHGKWSLSWRHLTAPVRSVLKKFGGK